MNRSDNAYFEQVYDNTYVDVLRYISRRVYNSDDASDLMQDIYTELYALIRRRGREYIKDEGAMVMTIAKRQLRKKYGLFSARAKIVSLEVTADDGERAFITDFESLTSPSADSTLEERELLDGIFAIARAHDCADIFSLRYCDNMSLEEISGIVSLPVHTVRNRLYRTLKTIKQTYNMGGKK